MKSCKLDCILQYNKNSNNGLVKYLFEYFKKIVLFTLYVLAGSISLTV